jgi:hypothetical protein
MRALVTARFIVFVTRHARGVDFVAARAVGDSLQFSGRRSLGFAEAETLLAELRLAGIEIRETLAAEESRAVALPAPKAAAEVPDAPAKLPKPIVSEWFSFSEILLKTQKIRGPNAR